MLQALGCLLSALQHRLPLAELLLPARLLLLELLTLLQQWQLGIQHLQRSGRLRKVLLGLLLRLLFLLELLKRFRGLGFSLDGLIELRACSALASTLGVAQRPALADQLLQLLIEARLDRLGLALELLQQPLLIDRGWSQAQGIHASLALPHPEVGPALA